MSKALRYKIILFFKKISLKLLFLKKKEIEKRRVNKILINSLYFIGDTIFHTPLFEALKYLFPDSEIDIWVKSRNYDVVKLNPVFSNIIIFDNIKTADYNEKNKFDLFKKLSFIKLIRQNKYDLYLDLTGKYSTALIALLGNFKYSAGINYHGFGFCYNKYVDINTSNEPGHLIDKYTGIIKDIFSLNEDEWNTMNSIISDKPYLYTDSVSKSLAEKELYNLNYLSGKPLICLHITAGWKAKEMDSDKFAQLIKLLIGSEKYNVVIIGTPGDKNKLMEIQAYLKDFIDLNKIFLSLPLLASIEIIKKSDLFIGADSAPLHIAGAVDTPSIALFGPTNPEFSKPRGVNHLVVYHKLFCSSSDSEQFCTRNAGKSCPAIDCMWKIEISEIITKIEYLLNNLNVLK